MIFCIKKRIRIFFVVAAFLLTQPLFSNIILLEKNQFDINDSDIEIFIDYQKTYYIEEISSPAFSKFINYTTILPKDKEPLKSSLYIWGRITIKNLSSQEEKWILENHSAVTSIQIQAYIMEDSKPVLLKDTINNGSFFTVNIKSQEIQYIYFRIENYTLAFAFGFFSFEYFINSLAGNYLFYGIFFGLILIMIFYNLNLYFSLKEISFLWYIATITALGLFFALVDRLPFFNTNSALITESFMVSLRILVGIFAGLFASSYLNLKKQFPAVNKALNIAYIVMVVLLLITLLKGTFDSMLQSLCDMTVMGMLVFIMVIAIISLIKGFKPALYFLISMVPFILAGCFVIIVSLINPNNITVINSRVFDITVMLIIFLFSLALSDRVYRMRKEKEDAQAQAIENLSKADQLKDEFLSNTSHELRTPLAGIIGLADLMVEGVMGELPGEAKKALQVISSNGKGLSRLINDILDFTSLKNGEMVVDKKPVDLFQLTEVAFSISYPLIANRNLKLVNMIDKELSCVIGDEKRLQQVMMNLLGNAIKFSEKGEIKVSAQVVDDFIEVSITDQGIGINEKNFELIFNPFVQEDGKANRNYEGTGIGLSIARKLVELQKGKLWVSWSKKGEGSTFTFKLPKSDQRAEEIAQQADIITVLPSLDFYKDDIMPRKKTPASTNNVTIFAIDDDIVIMQIVDTILTTEGYKVIIAHNSTEAQEKLNQGFRPDIVLLDMMMPRMTGNDICRKIREKYNHIELPVIMMTARNRLDDFVKGIEAGANDYLIKPFLRKELLMRIHIQLKIKEIARKGGIV